VKRDWKKDEVTKEGKEWCEKNGKEVAREGKDKRKGSYKDEKICDRLMKRKRIYKRKDRKEREERTGR
jgi:hypothetical protein